MQMKNSVLFLLLSIFSFSSFCQSKDVQDIMQVMKDEEIVWNRGDIEGYVQFYAPEDSVRMIYSSGISFGRDSILAFYKKYWPKERMGTLTLDEPTFEKISDKYYFVTGRFTVVFSNGKKTSGRFSSLMKKIKGRWYIYTDHSA